MDFVESRSTSRIEAMSTAERSNAIVGEARAILRRGERLAGSLALETLADGIENAEINPWLVDREAFLSVAADAIAASAGVDLTGFSFANTTFADHAKAAEQAMSLAGLLEQRGGTSLAADVMNIAEDRRQWLADKVAPGEGEGEVISPLGYDHGWPAQLAQITGLLETGLDPADGPASVRSGGVVERAAGLLLTKKRDANREALEALTGGLRTGALNPRNVSGDSFIDVLRQALDDSHRYVMGEEDSYVDPIGFVQDAIEVTMLLRERGGHGLAARTLGLGYERMDEVRRQADRGPIGNADHSLVGHLFGLLDGVAQSDRAMQI
jgi:hypothetical protein